MPDDSTDWGVWAQRVLSAIEACESERKVLREKVEDQRIAIEQLKTRSVMIWAVVGASWATIGAIIWRMVGA